MLLTNILRTLQWPAKSLNLRPIEHLLELLKTKFRVQPQQPNVGEPTRVAIQAWAAIPQQYLYRYVLPMRAKYRALIDAWG